MKVSVVIRLSLLSILLTQTPKLKAQTMNWKWAENTNDIIQINLGIDQGFVSGVGYLHRLSTKKPLFLNVHISKPAGRKDLDDFKTQFGAQMLLLNQSKLKGSIGLQGIIRKYENELVRIFNFGSELNGTIGYYTSKWFGAFNTSFDKAIISNFKHSIYFREHYYRNVKDGWYEPTMGGNIYLSLQTGYSFTNVELTLELGRIWNEDFSASPTIPVYGMLGVNYKFKQIKNRNKQ